MASEEDVFLLSMIFSRDIPAGGSVCHYLLRKNLPLNICKLTPIYHKELLFATTAKPIFIGKNSYKNTKYHISEGFRYQKVMSAHPSSRPEEAKHSKAEG